MTGWPRAPRGTSDRIGARGPQFNMNASSNMTELFQTTPGTSIKPTEILVTGFEGNSLDAVELRSASILVKYEDDEMRFYHLADTTSLFKPTIEIEQIVQTYSKCLQ
ncbi:unnamed protein product [Penicillium manginii]